MTDNQPRREQWFRPYFRKHHWRFAVIIALSALTLLSASALMFTSGYLISKSAMQPENILMVYVPVVLVRTFGIGRAVIHYLERLMSHDTILRILASMRVRLYRILEPQALFIRSRFRTGDMLSVLAEDIEQLQNVYLRTVFPSVSALFLFALGVIALGTFDLAFALLIAVHIAVILFVLPAVSLLLTRKKHQQSKQQRNELYQKLTDAVLGMSDWVISGRAQQFAHSYETAEERLAQIDRQLSRWSRWRTLLAQSVVGIVAVLVAGWSGQQVIDDRLAPVFIASFVLVVFPWMDAFLPVSEAVEKIPRYQDSLQRLEQISKRSGTPTSAPKKFLEIPAAHPSVKPTPKLEYSAPDESQAPFASNRQAAQGNVLAGSLECAEQVQVHIQLQQVRFKYDATSHPLRQAWDIDQVSLELPQGKKLALLGRSGAGKSTLAKLIQGAILPQEGEMLINGYPAASYSDRISQTIAVLNQMPHVFDTTVANNIRLGKPSATEDEIRQAAKQAQLDELINQLPEGYQTPMLETGSRFSGGERQRIALARILLQDAPVVILDEPTIGLDPRTERDLLRTMFQTLQGKTLIWITHHLVGVEEMDEVLLLERGRVKLQGAHAELLAANSYYRNLYELDRPDFAAKHS